MKPRHAMLMTLGAVVLCASCGDQVPDRPADAGVDAALDTSTAIDGRPERGSPEGGPREGGPREGGPQEGSAGDLPSPADATTPCLPATPPSSVKTSLVAPTSPVSVPQHFMGLHVGLHVPSWKPKGKSAIPAPTYPYGYARTLKVEVDGMEERGFWSNIEILAGVYDWTYMDKWFAAVKGHPVVWLIYGTPTFYQKHPNEPSRWPSWEGIASPPTDAGHKALEAFAKAAKKRYGAQIAAFEVWNEPTLPWTGGATSYNDRWSSAWGAANCGGGKCDPLPFFSGSASDLANIAYTLNNAGLGVPILGAAFSDQWETTAHTVTRFLNAPVTLPGATGQGKDQIQGLSIHLYDYTHNPEGFLGAIDGYRAKLKAAGVPSLPIWDTETGAEVGGKFTSNDPKAPVAIRRWTMLTAASRLSSAILYGHVSQPDATDNLGDPINNAQVVTALKSAATLNGATICHAAVLSSGQVWVVTSDGKVHLK